MAGRYLLDTNIVIALFADEAATRQALATAEEVFVPSIVVGELYFGAWRSERRPENIARIDEFAADSAVLGCDTETARQYGQIRSALRAQGRPLPENDIWIAAIALQYNLVLVTRDEHFGQVGDLETEGTCPRGFSRRSGSGGLMTRFPEGRALDFSGPFVYNKVAISM